MAPYLPGACYLLPVFRRFFNRIAPTLKTSFMHTGIADAGVFLFPHGQPVFDRICYALYHFAVLILLSHQ